jgi:diacylglycerol kinase
MKRLIKSFQFAIQGFRNALVGQVNLRIHLIASFVVIVTGFTFRVSAIEWCILLICIGIVIGLELINTAIERLVDMVSPEWKEQAGQIKDIAAAAVMIVSLVSLAIGVVIFGNHLLTTNY